jgi:hypothetical protein
MKLAVPREADVSEVEEMLVIYEEFKTEVRKAAERGEASVGLLAIPELRRTLGADIAREHFDELVMRLHADGLVHLMSHVDPESLSEETLSACISDDTGLLLYWLRWL